MTILKIKKSEIVIVEKDVYTSGSSEFFKVQFMFSTDWDRLVKTVTFSAGDVERSVILMDDICDIPHEVLKTPATQLKIGVYGTDGDTLILPTVWKDLGRISKGAAPGELSKEPTPDVYSQIIALEQQAVEIAKSVRQDADNGLFNGKPGKDGIDGKDGLNGLPGTPGADGKDGITPTIAVTGNWFIGETDTGKPSRGDAGEKGETPVKGIDYFTSTDKAEIVDDVVEQMNNDGLPSYWLSYLPAKADEVRQKMEEAGRNKSSFFFYSDMHYDYGAKKAPALLKHMYRNTPINKTIFGGDIVNSESSDRDVMEYLWEWREAIRDLPNHHSVVGNHDDGNSTNNLFPSSYIYAYLMAAEESNDIVRGDDFYYYIDDKSEKTRYLYIDTAYIGINIAQTAFITEALKTTPTNWHIVVVAHIWYYPDYDQYNVRPVPISGYGPGVENLTNLLDSYNARSGKFAGCTGKVEFCIGGHVHIDYTGRTAGGIPIILCETDSWHNRSGLTCTVGTTTESAVSAVIANYTTSKIEVVRVGRGSNFSVDIMEETEPEIPPIYTNLIPTSIDTDGSIYNDVGYKDVTMCYNIIGPVISSQEEYGNAKHSWISGLIPVNKGDVVRIKGYYRKSIEEDADMDWYNIIGFYNTDKSYNRGMPLEDFLTGSSHLNNTFTWSGEDKEDILEFTFTGTSSMYNNAGYMRLFGCYFENEADRLNSIATAVVTVNEPIE